MKNRTKAWILAGVLGVAVAVSAVTAFLPHEAPVGEKAVSISWDIDPEEVETYGERLADIDFTEQWIRERFNNYPAVVKEWLKNPPGVSIERRR